MEYTIEFKTRQEHIDVQGIMDGLYYPFYMEECRHRFIKEVMKFDIEEQAKQGINMVLSEYTIRFLRSLRKDDVFKVSCSLLKDSNSSTKFHLKQRIVMNDKTYTEAIFSGTCVPAKGGRPYLPDVIVKFINSSPDN